MEANGSPIAEAMTAKKKNVTFESILHAQLSV